MRVKALLRFWYEGKLVQPNEELELVASVAREVINSGKAIEAEKPPEQQED